MAAGHSEALVAGLGLEAKVVQEASAVVRVAVLVVPAVWVVLLAALLAVLLGAVVLVVPLAAALVAGSVGVVLDRAVVVRG